MRWIFALLFVVFRFAAADSCQDDLANVPFHEIMNLPAGEMYQAWVTAPFVAGPRARPFYATSDAFGEFSNFARYPVMIDGRLYLTSEHYFQSQKFRGHPEEEEIRLGGAPGETAQRARDRSLPLRPDWEQVKDDVMRVAVEAKFYQHPALADLLLSTDDLVLIEHTVNDRYWGDAGDGTGLNKLGLILMEVRDTLRASGVLRARASQSPSFIDYLASGDAARVREILGVVADPSPPEREDLNPLTVTAFREHLKSGMKLSRLEAMMTPRELASFRRQMGLAPAIDPKLSSRRRVGLAVAQVDPALALRLPIFPPGQPFVDRSRPREFVDWAVDRARALSQPNLEPGFQEDVVREMSAVSAVHALSSEDLREIEVAIERAASAAPGHQGAGDSGLVSALAALRSELWGRSGLRLRAGAAHFAP